MKLALISFAISFAGCTPSQAANCQTQACSSGSNTFQVCANADGTDTYEYGALSCTCAKDSCQTCTTEVANYCGPDSGGGGPCTATFSGGVSGTYSPCAVTITYTSSGTTIATAGNPIPGTAYTWTGFAMALAGMPATGTFDQTTSTSSSDTVTAANGGIVPLWVAGYSGGTVYGTASLTITSLGPSANVNGTTLYQTPHGTWTATLVDQNPNTAMPNIQQTVTF